MFSPPSRGSLGFRIEWFRILSSQSAFCVEGWLQRVREGNAKHPEQSLADPAPFIAPSRTPNEQEIERLKVGVVFYFFPPGRGLLGFWINGLEFYLI